MTRYRDEPMELADVKEVMTSLTEQLKRQGYQPTAMLQIAGIIFLTHGMAAVDTCPDDPDVVASIADSFRSVIANVVQRLIEYRHEEHASKHEASP